MTQEEKLTALLQNEENIKKIFVEDADQTLSNLAEHGIEMSKEELEELCVGMLNGMGLAEDELSEETLENVAGGGLIRNQAVKDVIEAVKGGAKKGSKDKKNKSIKGMSYVEEANTVIGKGWRAIGYTIGWFLS